MAEAGKVEEAMSCSVGEGGHVSGAIDETGVRDQVV